MLGRMFGPKRYKVIGGWRKLHNGELHNLYTFPSVIRMINSKRIKWVRHVACIGERRNEFWILVGRPEGKRPLGIPICRWEDNIKINHRYIGLGGMDWIDLAQNRDQWRALVNKVMNLRLP
jgi:hypothetical protein